MKMHLSTQPLKLVAHGSWVTLDYRQIEVCEIDIDIGDNLAIGMYAPRRGENEDERPLCVYARYGVKTFLPNKDE